MHEVFAATPLRFNTVTQPCNFGNDISIRSIEPILWNQTTTRSAVSERELSELRATKYWLCASEQVDDVGAYPPDALFEKVHLAMLALQVVCPAGGKNIYLLFHNTPRGFDNIESFHLKEMFSTRLTVRANAQDEELRADFDTVYQGVSRAFKDRIVRLQNPAILLEHALQIDTVELGMLMCVMGLDVLLMAGKSDLFVKRLGGLLGPQTRVFSSTIWRDRQPTIRVQDVASNLYKFRNIIAHGQEVPKSPFREEYELVDDFGSRIFSQSYFYREVMFDSGLFMLANALRNILVGHLADEVNDVSRWRQTLTLYEHRYQNEVMATPELRKAIRNDRPE